MLKAEKRLGGGGNYKYLSNGSRWVKVYQTQVDTYDKPKKKKTHQNHQKKQRGRRGDGALPYLLEDRGGG